MTSIQKTLKIMELEHEISVHRKRIEFLLSPEGRHWVYWQMENEGTYTLEDIDRAAGLS